MTYYYWRRILYDTVRSYGLLVAAFALLALFVGAESWRASIHCSAAAACVVASDDVPDVSGDIAAIVELSDDMSSDDPLSSPDEKAYKDTAASERLLFAAPAVAAAAILDRQWRTLYPDKTGPPRA